MEGKENFLSFLFLLNSKIWWQMARNRLNVISDNPCPSCVGFHYGRVITSQTGPAGPWLFTFGSTTKCEGNIFILRLVVLLVGFFFSFLGFFFYIVSIQLYNSFHCYTGNMQVETIYKGGLSHFLLLFCLRIYWYLPSFFFFYSSLPLKLLQIYFFRILSGWGCGRTIDSIPDYSNRLWERHCLAQD